MRCLLIFGASRGTGAQVVKYAQQQGYRCVAVVRNKESYDYLQSLGVEVILGDANDEQVVTQACSLAGTDCTIISTLGGKQANYQPQCNIINHAEKQGIKRMILVSSLGCGDSWVTLSKRAKQAFGNSVREKTFAEVWLQTSQLDYCIFRPGGLMDGEPTHHAQCYVQQEVHGYIMRSDLALAILQRAAQPSLQAAIFSIIDPQLIVERNK
ncbi:SDR family oxidoreductase [Orbus mooreae]|uniref:SDR family oxidoreductase n=1 Tax=Orbus mooreae TaxID=3074107 RepID=UPI00370DD181